MLKILGLLIAICLSASAAWAAPARDSFTGTVTGSKGAYRGRHGKVSVRISAPGSQESRRSLTLVFTSASCQGCLRIAGTARGYLSPGPRGNPDTGSSYTVSASGRVTGPGASTIKGTIGGTGFVARGRETMSLTLGSSAGSLSVTAKSAEVGGFTSP